MNMMPHCILVSLPHDLSVTNTHISVPTNCTFHISLIEWWIYPRRIYFRESLKRIRLATVRLEIRNNSCFNRVWKLWNRLPETVEHIIDALYTMLPVPLQSLPQRCSNWELRSRAQPQPRDSTFPIRIPSSSLAPSDRLPLSWWCLQCSSDRELWFIIKAAGQADCTEQTILSRASGSIHAKSKTC